MDWKEMEGQENKRAWKEIKGMEGYERKWRKMKEIERTGKTNEMRWKEMKGTKWKKERNKETKTKRNKTHLVKERTNEGMNEQNEIQKKRKKDWTTEEINIEMKKTEMKKGGKMFCWKKL